MPFRITVLGPFRLEDSSGAECLLRNRKTRALIGFLALSKGHHVPRERLAALLWDRFPEPQARASLRQALAELSGTLPPGAGPLLLADRTGVRINLALCRVDALSALGGAEAVEGRPGTLLDGLEGLSDSFDEWLFAEREHLSARLRQHHEAALARLSADDSRPEEALEVANRLLALEPAHEGAWRTAIRLTARMGSRAQALREYERCRATLRRVLDVEPSPETRELAASLRTAQARPRPSRRQAAPAPAPPVAESVMAGTARRMRVGVLPFSANGSEGGNALALAYARDTALELARFRRFDVISPLGLTGMGASSVPFDADLDYVVDGSLRGLDGSPHLVMSLLDVSELARPVWSERIALTESGAREVQGEAVQSLVARLDPAILFAEGTRSVVPAQRSDATCLVLRSIPMLYSMRQDRFEMAGELLAEAVAREPENAMAAAWAAHWHVFYIGQGWARNPLAALQEAERLAVLAMQLDPENAEGYGIYGHVCSFLHKDFDSAAYYLERSLSMNPNQASIWAMSAPTHCYLGNPGEALRRLDRYRSLAPFHPHAQIFEPMFTVAHTFGGDFEQAAAVGRRAVRASPDFTNAYKPLLSAMGHLGQKREARPYLEGLMRREPGFNVRDFIRNYPFRLAEDRERYAEGLRLAGVPKG